MADGQDASATGQGASPASDVTLVIRNASLPAGHTSPAGGSDGLHRVDIRIGRDRVVAIDPVQTRFVAPPGAIVVDAGGRLALAGFVEPHAHLDKSLTAGSVVNQTGDLRGAIDAWRTARPSIAAAEIAARASRSARELIAHGATLVRTHVDTGADIGTRAVDALVLARDRLGPTVDLELVPLAGLPLTGGGAPAAWAAVRDAARAPGVVAIGGAPYLDDDPRRALDHLAALAADIGIGLDLHVDETLDPGTSTLRHLVDLRRRGFAHPIVAGHCVSLAVQHPDVQRAIAEDLAEHEIAVVSLPQTNLFLQGRREGGPVARGIAPVPLLLEHHVRVAVGGDNVRDPFNPVGRNDPLEAAALAVVAGHLTPGAALHAIGDGARDALGHGPAGPVVGARADIVLVDAPDPASTVAAAPPSRAVFVGGRLVVDTVVASRWSDGDTTGRERVA